MDDSSIEKVYTSCKETSHVIWNDAKTDLLRCFAYYFHRILAIAKVSIPVFLNYFFAKL